MFFLHVLGAIDEENREAEDEENGTEPERVDHPEFYVEDCSDPTADEEEPQEQSLDPSCDQPQEQPQEEPQELPQEPTDENPPKE